MLTAAITGPVNIRIDQGVDAFLRLRDRATEAASLARAQNDLRQLGNASQVRVYGGYVLGHAAEMEAALEDLLHVGAETHEPFWTWRGYMLGGSRYLMRCDFAAATECVVQSSQLARSFGHVWGQVEGPLSVPSFLLRRETGSLGFARRLLEAGDVPARVWGPGLVALYVELGLADRARDSLRKTLAEDLESLRASYTWPTSLSLLGDAAVHLGDAPAAEQLLADAEPFSGMNLMGPEFLAAFGSADRLLAGLLGVLGRPGGRGPLCRGSWRWTPGWALPCTSPPPGRSGPPGCGAPTHPPAGSRSTRGRRASSPRGTRWPGSSASSAWPARGSGHPTG